MKIIKVVGHPVLVMSLFLLLLISGESFGGFYLMYILLGLPHGVPHALIAAAGIAAMFLGYKIYRRQPNPLKPSLYLAGNGLMLLALVKFFAASKGYNDATFHQCVPLISFVLFGLCVVCNVILSVVLFNKRQSPNINHLKVASE